MATTPQTIAQEAGLPDNWQPIDTPPIIPGKPAASTDLVSSSAKYLQGSLPPSYQHDTSFVSTGYEGGGTPQLSLMPLGVQGNPSTNAGVQSTSTKVVVENNSNNEGTGSVPGILGIPSGGTGTANPSLTAAADVVISGSWPIQTIEEVNGLLANPLPALSAGYLQWNGTAWVFSVPGGGFSAGGDLSGSSVSQEVIGILSNALPSLPASPSVLEWTGSAWSFSASGNLITYTSPAQSGAFSHTLVASTAVDGFWIGYANVTVTAVTSASVAPFPSLQAGFIYGLSQANDYYGVTPPQTNDFLFGLSNVPVSYPVFLPAGSAIAISTTFNAGSGGALTYTVSVWLKML